MIITRQHLTKRASTPLIQGFYNESLKVELLPETVVFERVNEIGSSIERTEESEMYLELKWSAHLRRGFKPWPNDTQPSRYKLVETRHEAGRLVLVIDPDVSYKDYVGGCDDEIFTKVFGNEAAFNPLACSGMIVAKSEQQTGEFLMITVRSAMHDYKPGGYLASFGGYFDIRKDPTPTSAFFREVEEEAGIAEFEIENLTCLGTSFDPWTAHSDLIWQAKASITAEEIIRRKNDKENVIHFIPVEADILKFLLSETAHAVPANGLCGTVLFGRQRFGEKWYEEVLFALARRSIGIADPVRRRALEVADAARLSQVLAYAKM